MNTIRLCAATLLTGLLSTTSVTAVNAADLGGNCCADLEERVAELEATTARKGNRKVSLAITGYVAEQVMWYDNGATDDFYVTGIGSTLNSNFKLTGSANINSDVSAGYVIQVEVSTSDPLTAGNTAFKDDGPSAYHITNSNGGLSSPSIDVLYSYWFIDSKRLGKVTVGQLPQASEHAAVVVDGSGSFVAANWVPLNGTAINLAHGNNQLYLPNGAGLAIGALQWCSSTSLPIAGDCNAIPINGVRYDSPTFAGFSVSTTWGEDDFWDVAGRFAGEFNGIKLAASIAYSKNNDESNLTGFNTVLGLSPLQKRDAGYLQIGAYIQHVPTGLFAYGAYGKEYNKNVYYDMPGMAGTGAATTRGEPDGHTWYVKAGLRRKWMPLGHTVLYGDYSERNDTFAPNLALFGVTDSKVTQYGLGVVQEIDAAAMSMWINWNHSDPEAHGGRGNHNPLGKFEDLDVVTAGALISF